MLTLSTPPPETLWPADRIERWPLARLTRYAHNARTHSEAQITQIAASIREFGWTMPILVEPDGTLIAGHGRVSAAATLGITDVPVMIARGWTPAQVQAYRIADNKLALNAGWDEATLRAELAELASLDYNLMLTGFGTDEIDKLLRPNPGNTDPDDVPEPPAQPAARLGDVWRLGAHTLACGDATDPAAVARALAGVVPHLMVTDPPYGVDYDPDWRNEASRWMGGTIGGRAVGRVTNDTRIDWREAWALFPGDVAYIWYATLFGSVVQDSIQAAGLVLRSQIVWVKSNFAIGRGNYHWQHEGCWYAVRQGATASWQGDRTQSTVWDIPKSARSETGHSTQKPVECMRRPIENNSSVGQAVYEPFCGSGTTIIAAEMTGRACHALEISPVYVDTAILRWQAFTGETAVLTTSENGGEGLPYAAVLVERVPPD